MAKRRIFDSHAHYDDERFEGGEIALLNRLHEEENVALVLNAAASLASIKTSMSLSDRVDFVFFSSGVHPEMADVDSQTENWLDTVKDACAHNKCKAIGEIGLDYYYGNDTAEIQKEVFRKQLALASELSLPVIIHDREAHGDCLEIISEFPDITGVFHSYSGSSEMAKELLKKGWYISFNGIVTFKNARKTVEVAECIRDFEGGKYLDKILVETDCPYLAPVPERGHTNHSGNIKYTAAKLAEILGMTDDELCELTYKNACRFYGLEDLI